MKLGPTQLDVTIAELEPEAKNWPLGVTVKITQNKQTQTESQRGYYWASLKVWGKDLGYSAGETEKWLHNAVLCQAYGTKEYRQIGGSVIAIPNQRSSTAKRDEYSELIRVLIDLASDQGFHIEQPRRAA